MSGFKAFLHVVRSYKLIHIFIVYISSSAVILEVTDVLQNHDVLGPSIFSIVLWLLLAGLPVAILLTWIIRKRMKDNEPPGLDDPGPDQKENAPRKKVHNLPESITRFIGREKETRELSSLVENNRLVTITGEGGCGKTRISLEIARAFLDQFTDGVWFVDLAPVEDPGQLPQEIISTLSISEEPGKPVNSTLKEQIGEKMILLLLDNCEHLVNATADLAQSLLSSSPNLKVLATSREALKISGEVLWKVPTLSLPEMGEQLDLGVLGQSEAMQLFLDRAGNCKPAFKLTQQNAMHIAQVCLKLEGIPLAIELAATRIRHMEPKMILDRISDRFQLLSSDSRSLGSRQKTLQATIEWSYDLLTKMERMFFERLSVFAGGFLVETAEEVCADDQLVRKEVFDTLSNLVDKSMIFIQPGDGETVRYGMLETIKEFAAQKLAGHDEDEMMNEKHFRYFLELADRAFEERLETPSEWADKLAMEHDEYMKAVKWSEKDPQNYIDICGALGWFWEARSHYHTGLQHLKAALSVSMEKTPSRARALMAYGTMGMWFSDMGDTASEALKEALEIWVNVDNKKEAGQLHFWLGTVKTMQGDMLTAMDHLNQGYSILKSLGDPRLMVNANFGMGFGYICSLEPLKAEPLIVEAMQDAIKYGMKREIGFCRHALADCALISKDYAVSLERYKVALKAVMEAGDLGQALYELQGIAMSQAGISNSPDSIRLNSAAIAKSKELGIELAVIGFWDHCLKETIGMVSCSLGEQKVSALEREGSEMGFERAVELGLNLVPAPS